MKKKVDGARKIVETMVMLDMFQAFEVILNLLNMYNVKTQDVICHISFLLKTVKVT